MSAPGTVQGLLDTCCSISRSYPDIHQKFRLWFRSQILWETQRKLKRLKLTTSNHIKIIPFQIDFLLLHPPENIAFRGNRSQTMVWNGLNYLFKELWENESKYQADRKIIVVVSKMRWLKIWAYRGRVFPLAVSSGLFALQSNEVFYTQFTFRESLTIRTMQVCRKFSLSPGLLYVSHKIWWK